MIIIHFILILINLLILYQDLNYYTIFQLYFLKQIYLFSFLKIYVPLNYYIFLKIYCRFIIDLMILMIFMIWQAFIHICAGAGAQPAWAKCYPLQLGRGLCHEHRQGRSCKLTVIDNVNFMFDTPVSDKPNLWRNCLPFR